MKKVSRILTVSDPHLAGYCKGKHGLTAVGVFSSGIYFEDERQNILMLHDRTYGSLPFGFAGADISDRAKELGLTVGSVLKLENCCLLSENGALFAEVKFSEYVPEKPSATARVGLDFLKTRGKAYLTAQKKSTLSIFAAKAASEIDRSELDDAFAAVGLAGVLKIERGLRTADVSELSAGLDGVLGLGRGLTPSFDDFITGMLTTYHFCAAQWGIELPAGAELSSLVAEKAREKTNRYSAAYLMTAASGGRFSAIFDVLSSAGGENWLTAAEKLISIGASSGADMMAGMIFAARIIN